LPPIWAGVARKYSWPSSVQTIKFGDQSIAYGWKPSPSAEPMVVLPPTPLAPE
jgi:hypothetical protein